MATIKNTVKITLLMLITVFNIANADELHFNDGRILTGKILSQEGESVKFSLGRTGTITTEFNRSEIKDIVIKPLPPEEPKKEIPVVAEQKDQSQPVEMAQPKKEVSSPEPPKKIVKKTPEPKIINDPAYILYIPGGLSNQKRYPLVIALSPSADAQSMIDVWKQAADKHKWMIMASKKFQNGVPVDPILGELASAVSKLYGKYPVSKTKVIASGFSGGAMGSHMFACKYPDLIKAVVANTGMINENYISQKSRYPRNKLAVFIASASDFRYNEMKRDRKFLEDLGWKTKWTEFGGGHMIAPASKYEEAAAWLDGNL
jgi:predicted esterase